MPKFVIDPVKQSEQFKADLAAMAVGQKKDGAAPQQRMLAKNFGVASFKYNEWSAMLTEAQTIDDAMQPQFWDGQAEHVMGHDKANPRGVLDLIHVRKPDAGLYVLLLITEIGKGFIKTVPVQGYAPPEIALPEGSALAARWNVGRGCHEVIRSADKQVMQSGFQTKESAVAWIASHMKAMAA